MDLDQLLEAWRVNNALNLEWLDAVQDADLEFKPGKGKTIRSNFVHIIGVRRMWAEEKLPKEAAAIPKYDWKTVARDELREGMLLSSDIMELCFEKRFHATKPGRFTLLNFFAYCIAHEAHHRSQIEIAMRINGADPDDKFLYGLWDWSHKLVDTDKPS